MSWVVIAVAVVDLYTEDILLYILEVCSQPHGFPRETQ